MQIDNYTEATALTKKLEAAVPFKVRPGKPFLKLLQENNKSISPDHELEVELVAYSGDAGGIMCTIHNQEDEQAFVTSLTHLKFDPTHPLAEEVKAYQQHRIQKLKLQDRRGFLAEMNRLDQSPKSPKKKGGGGFSK